MALTTRVFQRAGDAVMQSSSLAEALEKNPYETRVKRAMWERVITRLWAIRKWEEAFEKAQQKEEVNVS